jgi:hypothetical protein
MKKIVSTTWLLLLLLSLNAQTIPADRRVNWKQAIQSYTFKEPKQIVNILDFGGIADGKTDNSAALKQAIVSFQHRAGTVLFPAGTFLFNTPIVLPDSIQLKGAGSDVSVLAFNLNHESKNCIRISGTAENHFVRIKGGYSIGSTKLLSDSAAYFSPGDWVEILENNGNWNTVPAEWAKHSVGQIAKVKDIMSGVVILEIPLRISYQSGLNPRLQRMNPVKNVAVSCLKIMRVDKPDTGGGYNIFMDYAVNSRIAGVESDTSSGSHLYVSRSAQIKVAGCYFHHAFAYDGVSTHGYGVTLAHHSSGCLVVNNIFAHLRHAMMVKTGSNGNVFAYNYSRDPVRSEAISNLSGDISLHGHYPFANLFEGNIVQNIIIDHYWGPSGPMNTFFRNRAELWGIIMTQSDTTETSRQNFVGNECTNTGFLYGQFKLFGADNFVYANNVLGVIIPDSSGNLPDSSYYLSGKPDFWKTDDKWPDIGLPNKLGTGTIPAKQRFEDGGLLTVCPEPVTAVRKFVADDDSWQIGPNPVRRVLSISVPPGTWKGVFSVRIFDLHGKLLTTKKYQRRNVLISLDKSLKSGVYLLEISSSKGRFLKKIILAK